MIHPALTSLIERYQPRSSDDYQHAVREIVQEIALLGLWRTSFYEHAAFYGGSALRIFHGLQRFSEDLDFSLLRPEPDFSMAAYLGAVAEELAAWGFEFRAERIGKSQPTSIESAFLKGSTMINLLHVGAPAEMAARLPKGQLFRIKLEIDLDPPNGAATEVRSRLVPTPHQVRVYDLPSLFAGKLHAVLCRNWKSRVKGRDFYDLIWYVGRRTPPYAAEPRASRSPHAAVGRLAAGDPARCRRTGETPGGTVCGRQFRAGQRGCLPVSQGCPGTHSLEHRIFHGIDSPTLRRPMMDQDHSMLAGHHAALRLLGRPELDPWEVNTERSYYEEQVLASDKNHTGTDILIADKTPPHESV